MLDSRCPICSKPLTGKQSSACSNVCRAALSRRRRAEGQLEKNRRVRELLKAAARVLSGTEDD
jgi:predicted nucleic acid-binding Zn ribbon protein